MQHSVQAYLERVPIDKLRSFLDEEDFVENYASNPAILKDILEALCTRNATDGGLWTDDIIKLQSIQFP